MARDAFQQLSQQKPQFLLKQRGHWMKKAELSTAFFEDWKKASKKARRKARKKEKKKEERKSIVATSCKLRPSPPATTETQSKLQSHHRRC